MSVIAPSCAVYPVLRTLESLSRSVATNGNSEPTPTLVVNVVTPTTSRTGMSLLKVVAAVPTILMTLFAVRPWLLLDVTVATPDGGSYVIELIPID